MNCSAISYKLEIRRNIQSRTSLRRSTGISRLAEEMKSTSNALNSRRPEELVAEFLVALVQKLRTSLPSSLFYLSQTAASHTPCQPRIWDRALNPRRSGWRGQLLSTESMFSTMPRGIARLLPARPRIEILRMHLTSRTVKPGSRREVLSEAFRHQRTVGGHEGWQICKQGY